MQGRTPNKQEREWLSLVAQIPCVVCLSRLNVESPAEIHHTDGKTKPNAHLKILPLCAKHHRHADPDHQWVSRHGDGKAAFEAAYGPENALLSMTGELVEQLKGRLI